MSFPRQYARTQRFTLGVPRSFSISPDGERIVFLRGRHGTDTATCLWSIALAEGRERIIVDPGALGTGSAELPEEERARRERARETGGGIVSYSVDSEVTRAVLALSGELYLTELTGDDPRVRPLPAATPAVDPSLSPAGDSVAYVHEGAVHVLDIATGTDREIATPDGAETTWGLAEFVAAEEMGRFRGMWWAPDGSALLAARVDDTPVTRWHLADPATPEQRPRSIAYPAAGTPNAEVRLAVLPLREEGGGPVWLEWDREAAPYLVSAGWTRALAETPTAVFSVQSRDQRRLSVHSGDPGTGVTTELHTATDPAWVEIMPGVPEFTRSGELVRIERQGDDHRLVIGADPVTPPGTQVRAVLDVDGDTVLFTASREPTTVELWAALGGGGGLVELGSAETVATGRLRGGTLVRQERGLSDPMPRTSVLRLTAHAASGAPPTRPEESLRIAGLAQRPELPAPRVELWSAGEREIRSALVLPSWYEPHRHGRLPVLMDPYGGPHAQRVLKAQAAYLTSQWFAEHGFAVVVADGRGTPGRGAAWERAVHGDLASPVLEDQIAALHSAAERFGHLDLERVTIRGWSFGGYLAALAVLRRPDVFHAAIAGAPVTDFRLYDTHYTERYLGLPHEEPENYRGCSLLTEAAGLRRPLMLIHGLVDDNVVFAHTQRLSSALLEAGRPHTVLPLSGITHMPSEETTAENLLLLQVRFLRESLGIAVE